MCIGPLDGLKQVEIPVNVLLMPGGPTVGELGNVGVRRFPPVVCFPTLLWAQWWKQPRYCAPLANSHQTRRVCREIMCTGHLPAEEGHYRRASNTMTKMMRMSTTAPPPMYMLDSLSVTQLSREW